MHLYVFTETLMRDEHQQQRRRHGQAHVLCVFVVRIRARVKCQPIV